MTKYIGPKTDGENVATQADKLSLSSETPDALTPDQSGAAGTATTAARSDHQHEILAGTPGTILPDDVAAEGSSTSFARADHTHAITAAAPSSNLTGSSTNSEGTATSFARSDHSHAITTAAPGTILPDDAAAAGTSANLARADHTHAIAAASAGTITGTNAEGTSTSFARADHNHAYGNGSIPHSALASDVGTGLLTNAQSTTVTTASQVTVTNGGTFYDVSGLSVAITPSATASKVLVMGQIDLSCATTDALVAIRIVRGSTAVGVGTSAGDRIAASAGAFLSTGVMTNNGTHFAIPFHFLDSPNTTSSITYKIQVTTNSSSTVSVNRSSEDSDASFRFRSTSTISAIEVR